MLRVERENPQGQIRRSALLSETMKLIIHYRIIADPPPQDRFVEHHGELEPVPIHTCWRCMRTLTIRPIIPGATGSTCCNC